MPESFSFNQSGAGGGLPTSTSQSLSVFGAAGSTKTPAYTTAAITTARAFASTGGESTANVSTFTGVSGAGCAFNTRAVMEAWLTQVTVSQRNLAQMYEDLKAYGILR